MSFAPEIIAVPLSESIFRGDCASFIVGPPPSEAVTHMPDDLMFCSFFHRHFIVSDAVARGCVPSAHSHNIRRIQSDGGYLTAIGQGDRDHVGTVYFVTHRICRSHFNFDLGTLRYRDVFDGADL